MTDQQKLTHFDESGASRMVDVSEKAVTARSATAEGYVRMQPATRERIVARDFRKGDVLEVARLAGLMGCKRTADLIPLCHTLPLESAKVELNPAGDDQIHITATVKVTARTGVEMESLTAVSVAALTIYDMCKAIDRGMEIHSVRLVQKAGGQSGDYRRDSEQGVTGPANAE
ncbi:MAG: cyclic pyranopterin monophosphate synthase MoaC [Rubinisphaera brasiliensis]|uniref:cyclic pyranopterin monophosphate synthase MoaC n=1 Tax=Rubinisphaera brasiliensis TaxID=119 RepID=UPI00391AB3CB